MMGTLQLCHIYAKNPLNVHRKCPSNRNAQSRRVQILGGWVCAADVHYWGVEAHDVSIGRANSSAETPLNLIGKRPSNRTAAR